MAQTGRCKAHCDIEHVQKRAQKLCHGCRTWDRKDVAKFLGGEAAEIDALHLGAHVVDRVRMLHVPPRRCAITLGEQINKQVFMLFCS